MAIYILMKNKLTSANVLAISIGLDKFTEPIYSEICIKCIDYTSLEVKYFSSFSFLFSFDDWFVCRWLWLIQCISFQMQMGNRKPTVLKETCLTQNPFALLSLYFVCIFQLFISFIDCLLMIEISHFLCCGWF